MKAKIRKAKINDAKNIQKLVNYYADKKIMLPRALNEIYENIQGYFIIELNKKIIGCSALAVSWEDLAEIKSLAVSPSHGRKGLGTKLVEACEREARKIGIKKIFVLTYVPEFFGKLGFKRVPKETLPHKIWTGCIRCPFFPNCNEVPLIKQII